VCSKTLQYLGLIKVLLEVLKGEQVGVILMHHFKKVVVARMQVFDKLVDIKHVQSVVKGPFSET